MRAPSGIKNVDLLRQQEWVKDQKRLLGQTQETRRMWRFEIWPASGLECAKWSAIAKVASKQQRLSGVHTEPGKDTVKE